MTSSNQQNDSPNVVDNNMIIQDVHKYRRYLTKRAAENKPILVPDNIVDVIVMADYNLTNGAVNLQDITSTLLTTIFFLEINYKAAKRAAARKNGDAAVKNNLSRFAAVPDRLKACKSNALKAAIKMHCVSPSLLYVVKFGVFLDSLTRRKSEETVQELMVNCASQSHNDLKKSIKPISESLSYIDDHLIDAVFKIFMLMADTLKDKSFAHMAYSIDEANYNEYISTKCGKYHTIYPFMPLIAKYIKTCISPNNAKYQQAIVQRQLTASPASTVRSILGELERAEHERIKQEDVVLIEKTSSKSSAPFDPNVEYEVLLIPNNNKLCLSSEAYKQPEEMAIYNIQLYNYCLFDILGCKRAVRGTAAEFKKYVDWAFHGKTNAVDEDFGSLQMQEVTLPTKWSDRLQMINSIRGTVDIQKMSGEELNNLNQNMTVVASWTVGAFENRMTKILHKKYKRKPLTEEETDDAAATPADVFLDASSDGNAVAAADNKRSRTE